MKNFLQLYFSIFFTTFFAIHFSNAQTSIPGGNVFGTWTLSGSPYNIQGSIQIPSDSILHIEAGVNVIFQGQYKLNVIGRLRAIGTTTDTILFTAADTINKWKGINFTNTNGMGDSSKIIYCKIQYSKEGAINITNFSKLAIRNCFIIKCHNTVGGGLYLNNSSPVISGNTIMNCTSLYAGGGMYLNYQSNPQITNNFIIGNKASNEGGGIFSEISNPLISGNTISGNTVDGNGIGAGLCIKGSNAPLINNIISNNIGVLYGGGLYLNSCNLSVTGNNISNNSNSNFAGGIYCTGSTLTISNNIISNNTSVKGGGLYFDSNFPYLLLNNTIVNNAATNGGGLFCQQSASPEVYNCIIWGNTATTSGMQVYLNEENNDPDFFYCNIEGGSSAFELNGNFYIGNYQNNIDSNPLFITESGGSGTGFNGTTADWSLQGNSPCIDIGDPLTNSPVSDFAGNPRITNCHVDMGAFEYQLGTYFTVSISQTASIPCYGYATAALQASASGVGAPFTYEWNSGDTTAIITNLTAGTYTVTVTNSNGCILSETATITQPPTVSLQTSQTKIRCHGECTGSAAVVVVNATSPYTYLWSSSTSDTSAATPANLCEGTYSVTVTDTSGCMYFADVAVTDSAVLAFTANVIHTSECNNNDGGIDISPSGGIGTYSYTWSNGSSNQDILNIESGSYTVTVTDNNNCSVSNVYIIQDSIVPISVPICMVTVDSTSTKNIIVWEKPISNSIESFKIYREIASSFTLIGTNAYSALSEFTDNSIGINPNSTAYKYKIAVLDSCGNESILSPEHQTLHLQISLAFPQGVNLSWNDYEGFSFLQYRILRDNNGDGNWYALDSVSYGTNTYTSTDVLPNARYIIEVVNPMPCVSTRETDNTRISSRSNMATQTTGIDDVFDESLITIFPNPTSDKFTIQLDESFTTGNNLYIVNIYNVLGELYLSKSIRGKVNELNISTASPGIYFLKIEKENTIYTKKIIKNN